MKARSLLQAVFSKLADALDDRSVSGTVKRDPVTGIVDEEVTMGRGARRAVENDPALADVSVSEGTGVRSLLHAAFSQIAENLKDYSVSGSVTRDPETGTVIAEELALGPDALRLVEKDSELAKAVATRSNSPQL